MASCEGGVEDGSPGQGLKLREDRLQLRVSEDAYRKNQENRDPKDVGTLKVRSLGDRTEALKRMAGNVKGQSQ